MAGGILVVFAATCGTKQPGVTDDNYKVPKVDHTGLVAGCAECHEAQRLVDPHPQGVDCSACHTHPLWAKLSVEYKHDAALASCAVCHEKNRPKSDSHPASGDCHSCHGSTAWQPNVYPK